MTYVLYDGECGLCKKCVNWLKPQTGTNLDFIAYQNRPDHLRFIPDENLKEAVHLVDEKGSILKGAAAVYRSLEYRPGKTILYTLYKRNLVFRKISDWGYKFAAQHRSHF